MTMERYNRNRIYVTKQEQEHIRNSRILLGGAGIGSIVAECALRFGFENITVVVGDKVEESNLNRQNYTYEDIGKHKAECLARRLMQINPEAHIEWHNTFIDENNVETIINGHDIAINALDFKSSVPFMFDRLCSDKNIPVLHPYNFGWAGFLTIIKPGSYQLTELSDNYQNFELTVAEYVARCCASWIPAQTWLSQIIDDYKNEPGTLPPPQLSVASWIAASHCVHAMFNIATGKPVKYFPKFYFSSLMGE